MEYRHIKASDDGPIARIIRDNLKANNLDIPGTVYFDSNLDHISAFYMSNPAKRDYYVLTDAEGMVIGGIGLAEFDGIEECAELQKLYLADEAKGNHLGYDMIKLIEERAAELGYRQMYLETHTNLAAAIYIYEKCGYKEIPKPESVVHSGMNRFYIKELQTNTAGV